MARSVPEWIGKTPDTKVPDRVKLRVWERHEGRCHICTAKIMAGDLWDTDHVKRLKDGGENRESNLAPAHKRCHARKTAEENRQQAVDDRKRKKHLGITGPKQTIKGRGFRKADPQRSASRPLTKTVNRIER